VLRHEFRPGRLTAGIFLTSAGVVYLGDASGAWKTPWFAIIPMVVGGLCLAAATGMVTGAIRRGFAARREVHGARKGATTP